LVLQAMITAAGMVQISQVTNVLFVIFFLCNLSVLVKLTNVCCEVLSLLKIG